MQPEAKLLGTPSGRNTECKMRNEKERLMQLLDAEYMWSEKDCAAVADYLITSGLGFVDDVRKECGNLLAAKDVIINDMNEKLNRLMKENEILWKKQIPLKLEEDRCPVCGRMQFLLEPGYCKKCGQALFFEDTHSPSVSGADSSLPEGALPGDDIELLTNINDRS